MIESFADTIKIMVDALLSEVNTCLPGQIETYDPTTKKASVKPLLKRVLNNGNELVRPVINNVPVVFPSSSNSIISVPLAKGDGCLIVFSMRSLDDWLSKGGDVAPDDPRKFDLSDAVCIPGLFSFKNTGKVPEGSENIEIKSDKKVELQGNADNAVRFSELKTAYDQLKSDFDNHVSTYNAHTHVTTATVSSGPPGTIAPTTSTSTPSSGDVSGAKVEEVLLP